MFGWFKKKAKLKTKHEKNLYRLYLFHEACMLIFNQCKYPNEDKVNLAINLYFLGAIDCSCQQLKFDEKQFGQTIIDFYEATGFNNLYSELLARIFVSIKDMPEPIRECVIEGGSTFNKWSQGDTMIPITFRGVINKYYHNEASPQSPGHIYVEMEKYNP